MGKIIAVANQKGGVGKTTTTINLSATLAEEGCKVLIVDMDPQGNATSGIGIPQDMKVSSYEVLIGAAMADMAIINTALDRLSIIPSRMDLTAAEIELVPVDKRETMLKHHLSTIKGDYEYIFIDCPPSLGLLTVNALTAADSVLIPLQCEYYAMEGLSQLMNTIRLIRENLNPDLALEGILLTMYDQRNNLSKVVASEVQSYFSSEVFETVIPRNVRLSEAPSYGQPINIYDKNSAGAIKYAELAIELMKRNASLA